MRVWVVAKKLLNQLFLTHQEFQLKHRYDVAYRKNSIIFPSNIFRPLQSSCGCLKMAKVTLRVRHDGGQGVVKGLDPGSLQIPTLQISLVPHWFFIKQIF